MTIRSHQFLVKANRDRLGVPKTPLTIQINILVVNIELHYMTTWSHQATFGWNHYRQITPLTIDASTVLLLNFHSMTLLSLGVHSGWNHCRQLYWKGNGVSCVPITNILLFPTAGYCMENINIAIVWLDIWLTELSNTIMGDWLHLMH